MHCPCNMLHSSNSIIRSFIECVHADQLSCDKLVICLYCNQEVLNTNHKMVHMCISANNNGHLTCLLQKGKAE